MAKKHLFLSFFLTAMLCIAGINNAWATGEFSYNSTTKTLTINKAGDFASGVMPDYSTSSIDRYAPWKSSYEGVATKIVIADGITNIGEYAFSGFSKVTDITIPVSVTSIGSYAFNGCSKMANIFYKGKPSEWASIDFINQNAHPFGARGKDDACKYYFYDITTSAPTTLYIEPTILEIKQYAFFRGSFSCVCVPGTVERIGDYGLECKITSELIVNRKSSPSIGSHNNMSVAKLYVPSGYSGYSSGWEFDAFDSSTPTSGALAEESTIKWSLSEEGILTIDAKSSAKTIDFSVAGASHPWKMFRRAVYKVRLKGEITAIGNLLRYHYGFSEVIIDQNTVPACTGKIAAPSASGTSYSSKFNKRDKLILRVKSDLASSANSMSPWNDGTNWTISTDICPSPNGLKNTALTTSSATFKWVPGGTETGWQYMCIPAGDTPDWNNGSLVYSTTANYTGLTVSDLSSNVDYVFYVRANCGTNGYSSAVSMAFTTLCDKPTGLSSASSITSNSASFEWDDASVDTWQYLCMTGTPTASDWNSAPSVTSNSVTVTGLLGGTDYKFYLRANCGGNGTSAAINKTFSTTCSAVESANLPFNEGFESFISGHIPACWNSKTDNAYANVQAVSGEAHSGDQSLRLNGGSYTDNITAIFPEFEDDIKDLALSFWYKSSIDANATYGRLQLGYVKDNEFHPVGNALEQTATYVRIEDFVISDAPEGAYFAIQYTGGISVGNAYIDDIEVNTKPTSARPTSLNFTYITDESAAITWNTNGMSAWKVQTSENGETWSEAVSVNTNSYTITGLNANTTYFVRVKGYNEEESAASMMRSFKTYCAGISTLPWTHDFEDDDINTIPDCWHKIGYYSEYSFIGDKPSVISGSNAHGGSGKCLFSYGGGANSYTLIMLPYFEETISNLAISFWYNNRSTYSEYGQTEIGYITDPTNPASFVSLSQLDRVDTYTYVNKFPMTGAPDNALIAIRHAGGSNEYGYSDIDDITVGLIPVCHAPTAITASNFTPSGATISWTAENEETAWKMQYSTDGENWTNVNSGNAITDNPYALTGLSNANTLYYVRVMAVCDVEDESSWSTPISFTTDCDAISSISASTPWEENFNAMSADIIPECWNNSASTATPYWGESYFIWGTYDVSGNKMLCMSNASVDGGVALINTPAFAIPDDGKEYEFMFDYANHASSDLIVKMSVDGSAFGVVNTYHNTGSNSTTPGELTSVRLSLYGHNGHSVKLQFYTTPASGYYPTDGAMFVDNLGVRKVPTEVFEDVASATNNQTRLAALMGQTLNITINRPLLRNGDYCTLTLPFDLSAEQIADENCPLHGFTIKEFARAESGESVNIYLNEVGAIEAGKPYFVRYAGTPTNERLTPLIFRNVTVTAYQPSTEKLSDECSPYAVFNPYELIANDQTTLFLSSANTLYYPSADGTMNGFRAYIKVSDGSPTSAPIRRGAPIRIVEQENTATGLESIQPSAISIQKVIREGQMIIIRDGKEYNAQGMRLQ